MEIVDYIYIYIQRETERERDRERERENRFINSIERKILILTFF